MLKQPVNLTQVTKDKDGKEKILEEEVEPAPFLRTLKLNKPELPYLVSGSIAATINGLFPFAFAMVLSEILSVSMKLNVFLVCTVGLKALILG